MNKAIAKILGLKLKVQIPPSLKPLTSPILLVCLGALLGILIMTTITFSTQTKLVEAQQSNERLTNSQYELQNQYAKIKSDYDTLQSSYDTLKTNFDNLSNSNTQLNQQVEESKYLPRPPYTIIEKREAKFSFKETNGTIRIWLLPMDSFEASYALGKYYREDAPRLIENQRNVLNSYINWCNSLVKSGIAINCQQQLQPSINQFQQFEKDNSIPKINFNVNGKTETPLDYTFFVQPSPFKNVVTDLKNEINDDQKLITELFNILKQGPEYVSEIKDTPRYPLETLIGSGGDCEDSAILMASLLRAASNTWKIQLVYMDADNPTDPKNLNHVAVYVDTGNYSTTIETTSKSEMNPYPNGVKGYFIDVK